MLHFQTHPHVILVLSLSPFFSMAMCNIFIPHFHTPMKETTRPVRKGTICLSPRTRLHFRRSFLEWWMGHWVTDQVPCPMSVSTRTPMPMPWFYFWGSSCLIWFCFSFHNWLVVEPSLRKIWVRQWEGWHPQYIVETKNSVWNHQPVICTWKKNNKMMG